MNNDQFIPGAPEVEEYKTALQLAGVTHDQLIARAGVEKRGSVNKPLIENGVRVVAVREAGARPDISAERIEAVQAQVRKETNLLQSRFVLGLIPSSSISQ